MHPSPSRRAAALALASLLLAPAGCRQAPGAPRAALGPALEDFVQRCAREHPVWATQVGLHAGDGQLDDLSRGALDDRTAWLRAAETDFERFEAAALSPDERVDLHVVRGRIAALRFDLEVLRTWETSPLLYTRLVVDAVHPLLVHETAPLPTRLAALAARLRQVPRLLEQARRNLQHPAPVQVETALRHCGALEELLQESVAVAQGAGVPPALAAEVRDAAGAAGAALSRFDVYLADDLLRRADGDFRLGRDQFDRQLQIELQVDWTSDEVRRRAAAEVERLRHRMYDVALPLWKRAHPGVRPPGSDGAAGLEAVVGSVLESMAGDHPGADELRDACAAAVDSLTRFCSRTRLVELDAARPLTVEWAPAFARGGPVAGCDPAGRLDGALPVVFYVQPLPADWTPEVVSSYLREYSGPMLQVLSMHEAVPGHFVQLCQAQRSSHVVRDLFANAAFVEGWASYAEELALDEGYGDGDPRLRLAQLKFALRAALNAVLDVGVHCDGMREAQALDLLRRVGFQEEAEARAKWVRVQLSSAQLCTYFVGLEEIRTLEAADRARAGSAWSRREFVSRLLAHGSPAVRDLHALLVAPHAGPAGVTPIPRESD